MDRVGVKVDDTYAPQFEIAFMESPQCRRMQKWIVKFLDRRWPIVGSRDITECGAAAQEIQERQRQKHSDRAGEEIAMVHHGHPFTREAVLANGPLETERSSFVQNDEEKMVAFGSRNEYAPDTEVGG